MNRRLNDKAAKHLRGAQLALVETALITFIEQCLGRVPSDEECLANGCHINVEGNELCMFEKDGKKLGQYYVWADKHVLALGFANPENPLELSVCQVREENYPLPVRLHVAKVRCKKEGA